MLVGHSYGGAVITNAATGNPNVKALVYVDAFVPDRARPCSARRRPARFGARGRGPDHRVQARALPGASAGNFDAYILPSVFRTAFADDLSATQAAVLAATQRPVTLSAPRHAVRPARLEDHPVLGLLGTPTTCFPRPSASWPQRAHSHIARVKASHLSMISHPAAVDVILAAAHATTPRARQQTQGVVMTEPGTPVVFIHGLWLHATSWEPWLDLFREAGYDPVAPGLAERAGHRRRGPRAARRWWPTSASTT